MLDLCYTLKEAIDIYIKLLVALISFIAPLIIHLLSVFSDGIAVVRRKYEEEQNQITKLIKEDINQEGANVGEVVDKNNNLLKQKREENTRKLNLLEPKRQIKRIFPALFFSLFIMAIYTLVYEHYTINGVFQGHKISILILWGLFLSSLALSILGVYFLQNVTWAVIEVKQEIADDNEKRKELGSSGLTKPDQVK